MGPDVTNKLEAGKGIGGVGIILARMASKYVLPADETGLRTSTNIFFIFSNALVVMALVLWSLLLRTPFGRSKFAQYEEKRLAKLRESASSTVAGGSDVEVAIPSAPRSAASAPTRKGEKTRLIESKAGAVATPLSGVLAAILKPAGVVCSTFVVCLACFPGLTTSLVSRTMDLGDWFPVLLVFAYNTADMIGKSLPAYKMLFTVDTLIAPALLHLLFIPLFVVVASSGPVADAAGADAAPLLALITSDQFAFSSSPPWAFRRATSPVPQ